MPTYVVDRDVAGFSRDQWAAAQRAVLACADELAAEGQPVRYLRCILLPGEARCLCLFEAADPQVVRALHEAAGIPFAHIAEAIELDLLDR